MSKELIGNGAHWTVYRITTLENELSKSVVFKEPLENQKIDKNIFNYKLIVNSNLPTLSKFEKKTIMAVDGIEVEDLNPMDCDGYYVSPNTVRTSENCAGILIKYIQNNKTIIPEKCAEIISNIIEHRENIVENREKLIEKKILNGAEKYVYENKICKISNFKNFLISSKVDMKKASDNRIELFSDVFFFRVSRTSNEIDYKIADFDCILSHEKSNISMPNLLNGNLEYFKTALNEYIKFFIDENWKDEYKKELENVW